MSDVAVAGVVVGASQSQLLRVVVGFLQLQLFAEALKEPELPGQVQLFMGVARCPVMQLQLFSLQAQLLVVVSPEAVE
jgi:hypothetical protein